MKIYIDGTYHEKEDARVSVYDHGLLYGDGVFEGIRIYNGHVFKLREHLERLFQSAHAIMLEIPLTIDELERDLLEAVKLNEKQNGYIRLIVTRGVGSLGINPASCPRATVIIIVDDIQLYPKEYYESGIEIITSSIRRISPEHFDPRIKSLNYLNNVLARIEANRAGCQEAVMLNRDGHVAECTGDNIFIVKKGILLTPSPHLGALSGITRQFIIELAGKLGIDTKECALTQYDLYTADEAFLTGTGAEIIPVIAIDGRKIGNGKPGTTTGLLIDNFIRGIHSQPNVA
jgi:branched-chain amino acid aminotransferase